MQLAENEMRSSEHNLYLIDFGLNLRRIRKAHHISMENLAFESDIDYRQIGRIERGEVNTTIISLLRISEVLHVDIKMLFNFCI